MRDRMTVVTRIGIRSSPRVKSGLQFRSERFVPAPPDHNVRRPHPDIFRKNPGPGYRHVLMVRHVRRFLSLLPDWPVLSVGLNTILLGPGSAERDGFHRPGLVAICAKPRNLCQSVDNVEYIDAHRDIFARLEVPIEATSEGHLLRFTESSLRA